MNIKVRTVAIIPISSDDRKVKVCFIAEVDAIEIRGFARVIPGFGVFVERGESHWIDLPALSTIHTYGRGDRTRIMGAIRTEVEDAVAKSRFINEVKS